MAFKMGEAFVEVTTEDRTDEGRRGIASSLTSWAGGLGLGALIGGQINAGLNIETGRANLQNQLGLTAEDAATYGNLAGSVYRDNYGESLEEVNGVIGQVGEALGGLGNVSNEEISDMTGEVITLAQTFDQDATESISALSSAVSNGLAPSLRDATDIATRVFQEGGPKAREFLEVLNEYGPNLANAGISMEQFGAMSVSYLDAGGFSVDQFADSIREMTIRVSDGSATSAGAFDTLGLNAEEMTAKMAQGGPAAQEAFSQIVSGLAGMTDPVAQNTAGAQLFGSMWEDSSGAILAGLTPVPGALGEVAGATNEMTEVAGGTGAARIETMKRGLEGLLTGAAGLPGPLGAIGGAIGAVGVESITAAAGSAAMVASFVAQHGATVGSTIATTAKTVATGAMTVATGIATGAQWLWNAALSANPIALVVIAIAALVAGLVWFFTQTELGREIITAVWGAIKDVAGAVVSWFTDTAIPALGAAWQWVVDKAVAIKDGAVGAWNGMRDGIGAAITWVQTTVSSIVSGIVGFLSGAWNGALGVVRSVWGAITGFISSTVSGVVSNVAALPGQIMGFFSNAGSWLLNAGRNVVTGLWNGISGAASWLWGRIRSWAGGIVDNVLGALGIHSPSTVMRDEVGAWIPPGVAEGIDATSGVVGSAMSRMVQTAVASAQDPVRDAAQELLTHMKLGGAVFEDFSFKGNSANVKAQNDALADQYYGQGGTGDATSMRNFLAQVVASRTPVPASPAALASAGRSIQIGNLTLQVEGKFDFSNRVEWSRFIEAVRDGLVTVERANS